MASIDVLRPARLRDRVHNSWVMPAPLRNSGIAALGAIPWGTHFCQFFETEKDLIDVVVPYFAAGLEQNETCFWLLDDERSEPMARDALRRVIPRLDQYEAKGALLFRSTRDWYLRGGEFDARATVAAWLDLLTMARARGFAGLRATAPVSWLQNRQWEDFQRYEQQIDEAMSGKPMVVHCAYPLAATDSRAVLEVASSHHLAVTKRDSALQIVETPLLRLKQLDRRHRQQAAISTLGLKAIREDDVDALLTEAGSLTAAALGTDRGIVWQLRPEPGLPVDTTLPVAEGTTWGVLTVRSTVDGSYNKDEVDFLQSMANVLALALERNAHRDAERREKEREAKARALAESALLRLHAIESITDVALGHMALDELLAELVARLRRALAADNAAVLLLDSDRAALTIRAVDGLRNAGAAGMRIPLESPISGRVLREAQPLIITDLVSVEAPAWHQLVAKVGFRPVAAMGVPLIVEGKAIGVVSVSSVTERSFTEDDLDLLRMVADRVAPAIERSRLAETLHAARARLEAVSRRLLTVQEEERRRVAMELHDELGQVLTAVKIGLETMPARVPESIESVDRALRTVRDLALELRPAMLDDLGLASALRWYADRFAQQRKVETHLAIEEVPHVDPGLATTCFRVVQEALTNVARHAEASNVWLELRRTSSELELAIRDDGCGFDVDAARERAARGYSLGMMGMEERVLLAGGSLAISSTPAAGTEVRARFPLDGAS